ncbi:MAG: 50S ribosomal protein L4 [Gammaproteobacteria bacterium]|nr:50S ribosomal protein L4 [Gammaproteobacteria bacterium]
MDIALSSGESLELNDSVFGAELNVPLVSQVVQAYLANGHTGTKAHKSRSDVHGGGHKPWRQKGTGRARAGTSRSPIWRGGGVTFAARPTHRHVKVNRKMYRKAMCCILSELIRQNRLVATSKFDIDAPKTSKLKTTLADLNLSNCLLVLSNPSQNIQRAVSNLKHVELLSTSRLNPVDLLHFENVLVDSEGLKRLEESLS